MKRALNILLVAVCLTLVGCRNHDNAQADYELGKQMRASGRYPEAMTCFLDAVHSDTQDHVILGRVWSNIADICQMETNYLLAYDMHIRSAECFQQAADSVHYYYALNNMAIQRALQHEKPAAYVLLAQVAAECADSAVLVKTLETRALTCLNVGEYDSAIFYVDTLQSLGNNEITGYQIKAQSFAGLNQCDSACAYARYILSHARTYGERNNGYYILTHYDQRMDTAAMRDLAIRRAGVQRFLQEQQGELAHAVEILQRDLESSSRFPWTYGVGIALLLVAGTWFVFRLRKTANQLAHHKMTAHEQLEQTCRYLSECPDICAELQWNDYDTMCRTVNVRLFGLADKLQKLNVLNENDIRLCILVFIGLSQKQMAEILLYSPKSIGRTKENTAQKLNIHGGELSEYLRQLVLK